MKRFCVVAAAVLSFCSLPTSAQPSWPEVTNETKAGSRWWWLGSAVDEQNLK